MTKDIAYSGYSAAGADYECPDGLLAVSHNVIHEDGHLKPIGRPTPIFNCNLGGVIKAIHHVPGQDNYIITRTADGMEQIFWLEKSANAPNESDAVPVKAFKTIKDVAIVGNVVALATEEGLRYLLWKDDGYVCLPNKPPFAAISFGMTRVGTVANSEDLNIKVTKNSSNQFIADDVEENSNAVYGLLLSNINEQITSKGYFHMPFFVRYAYRLYDGSHCWHSAPVLMLPSVIPPLAKVDNMAKDGDDSAVVRTTLAVKYFSLDYKIMDDGNLSKISDWKDIVAGIDVFVSAPIYTYDQSKKVKGIGSLRSVLLNSYYDWNGGGEDMDRNSISSPESVFVGHFADNANRGDGSGANNTGVFVDHCLSTDPDESYPVWKLPLNENFHDKIKGASRFYKIASIDMDDIAGMEKYKRLPFLSKDFGTDALETLPTLDDDYQSHCDLKADFLFSFNSRINMGGMEVCPAKPFPLASCVQATSPTNPPGNVQIKVYSRLNGTLCFSESELFSAANAWDLETAFPRYLYYPDSSAYKMELSCGADKTVLKLTPHDFLNGSYWYGDLGAASKPESAVEETHPALASVPLRNKVYTSEANNPFFFPATGINSVGSGEVFGLSSAAKALSQGQFGQFPLYAFASDGVWALQTNAQGTYSAVQPISREACDNPAGITQLDDSVVFPTGRGLMLVSGSQVKCLSDAVDDLGAPAFAETLPRFDDLLRMAGYEHDKPNASLAPPAPFRDFLSGCGVVYDYFHKRLVLYNEDYPYAYVMSLKSGAWATMDGGLRAAVPAYPKAYAVDSDGNLLDLSAERDAPPKGIFATRPLKLGAPDVLKTVRTAVQRGAFAKGHVSSVLYGSRDLRRWHLLASSRDHWMRGLSGSPYKFFRLACVAALDGGESVYGATVEFAPKQTNRLR